MENPWLLSSISNKNVKEFYIHNFNNPYWVLLKENVT